MDEERVEAVLRWLRDTLRWWSADPASRTSALRRVIEEKKEVIVEAVRGAVRDELSEYRDWLAGFILGGKAEAMGKPARGEEGRGDEADTGDVQEDGGEGS